MINFNGDGDGMCKRTYVHLISSLRITLCASSGNCSYNAEIEIEIEIAFLEKKNFSLKVEESLIVFINDTALAMS